MKCLPTFNCRTVERISDIKFQLDDVRQRLEKLDKYKAPGIYQSRPHVFRGDMIQFFKFERYLDLINWHHGPIRGIRRARLFRELGKNCEVRFNWFGNRIAGHWNALPSHVINASGAMILKIVWTGSAI